MKHEQQIMMSCVTELDVDLDHLVALHGVLQPVSEHADLTIKIT